MNYQLFSNQFQLPSRLCQPDMKTTSCPVTIDFLIRKGIINSDTGKILKVQRGRLILVIIIYKFNIGIYS